MLEPVFNPDFKSLPQMFSANEQQEQKSPDVAPAEVPAASAAEASPPPTALAKAAAPETEQYDARLMTQATPNAERLGAVAFAATPLQGPSTGKQAETDRLTMETLNRKREELNRKEQELRTLEASLNERLEDLKVLEVRLQSMLKDAQQTKDAKYRHLVDVLANMKTRQAAEVLETLDEKIAVRVLAGMKGKQAGEILTYVKATKAARLAESLSRMQMPFE